MTKIFGKKYFIEGKVAFFFSFFINYLPDILYKVKLNFLF